MKTALKVISVSELLLIVVIAFNYSWKYFYNEKRIYNRNSRQVTVTIIDSMSSEFKMDMSVSTLKNSVAKSRGYCNHVFRFSKLVFEIIFKWILDILVDVTKGGMDDPPKDTRRQNVRIHEGICVYGLL